MRVGTQKQHVRAARGLSATSSDVRPWCLLTCEAEPACRDCTCGSGSGSPTTVPTLSVGLLGPVWIYGPEVTRDPSVGYSGVRTVLPLGRKHQDRQERRTSLPGVRRRANR